MAWREVRTVRRTGSTNTDLVALAAAGEPAGLVLVAQEQTQGRGRLGRTWAAPPGSGLTFSVLLRPGRDASAVGWLPLLTGVAVARAVREQTGVDARLKWPNDILVSGRKLGGVLTERVARTRPAAVVVGVGLNVDMAAADLPVPTATSLLVETGAPTDSEALLAAVLARLADAYAAWETGRTDAEAAAGYRELCTTLGRLVRAELPGGEEIEGEAVDLDADGRLMVRTAQGVRTVGAGDVLHLP